MSNAFTRCPNGHPGEGSPHDFCGYQPGEHDADKRPLIFCERCGEVRALALPLQEPQMTANQSVTVQYVASGTEDDHV